MDHVGENTGLMEMPEAFAYKRPEDVVSFLPEYARGEDFEAKVVALAKYFGDAGHPEKKDIQRANVFFTNHRTQTKREQMARSMAKKITHPDKAFRRGLTFLRHPQGGMYVGQIFISRCWRLIND